MPGGVPDRNPGWYVGAVVHSVSGCMHAQRPPFMFDVRPKTKIDGQKRFELLKFKAKFPVVFSRQPFTGAFIVNG